MVLAALAVATAAVGSSIIETRVQFSAAHVIVLAAAAMVTPVAAGLVGLAMPIWADRRLPPRIRIFNAGMWSLLASAGAFAYRMVGGATEIESLRASGPLLLRVGYP